MRIEVVGDSSLWNKLRRIALAGAALAWLAAFLLSGVLENTYVNYPREPDSTHSRTVPHRVKGVVVYVTQDQSMQLRWLRWTQLGAGAVILANLLVNLK